MIRNKFIAVFLGVGIFLGASLLNAKGSVSDVPRKKDTLTAREAAIFYANVAARIQKEYVDDVTQDELLEGALQGMLSSLDPHSGYLTAEKLKLIKESVKGEYGGLGMEVTTKNGLVMIVTPMDDTPADRADLRPGDYIIMIDGRPVLNQDLSEIVKKMQGKPGTKVTLTIRRGDEPPFDVSLSRAVIKLKSVKWKIFDDVGYVRVINFINKNTKMEVVKAIKEIQSRLTKKLKGFVLDLRNNAGGLLDQAVDVTDIFIQDGLVVSIKGRSKEEQQSFRTGDDKDFINGLPLVVLINGGTASAPEIVAGALQDHGRAVILGTKSFGKGSVQVIMPMTNGGAIKMTTALYYTPSGRSIQKEGVEPDIEIKQAVDVKEIKARRLREKDFDNALENGEKDKKKKREKDKGLIDFLSDQEVSGEIPKDKALLSDFQLKNAVDVLKGMSIYSKSIVGKRRPKKTVAVKNP